jgi:plastocyanin
MYGERDYEGRTTARRWGGVIREAAGRRTTGMRSPLLAALTATAVAGALVAPAVAAPPPTAHPAAAGARVTLKDISFRPARVTIRAGQSVTWTWKDGTTPHNVTSQGKRRFRSSASKSSGTYTVRFARPGTYRYVCTIHFGMNGTVVVR